MRQTAGCGRVNGPFGNASTDIIKKKNMTHSMPAQIFSCVSCSLLQMEIISQKKKRKKKQLIDQSAKNFVQMCIKSCANNSTQQLNNIKCIYH